MAGGITGINFSRWQDFLTARGFTPTLNPALLGQPGNTPSSFAPAPKPSLTIEQGGQEINNLIRSRQNKDYRQESIATYDSNASNNVFANETNLQKATTNNSTNIDTSGIPAGLVGLVTKYKIGDNSTTVNTESEQAIGIDQIGASEEGGVATNNSYFVQDNTQLNNADNQESFNPVPSNIDPTQPQNYGLSFFNTIQGFENEQNAVVNSNRRDPIESFVSGASQLGGMDRDALGGLLRTVGKNASRESRQAGRAFYALASLVGTTSQSSYNRAYRRLEEALQPMDPNVGYDYNRQDAQVFMGAVQSLVNYLPSFLVDDPDLIGQIQYSLADIANSLNPTGGNSSSSNGVNYYA